MTHRPFSLSRRGRRFLALALAACMLCAALPQALAANPEVDAGMVYCFQSVEFQTGASDDLTGICVTGVPQSGLGTVQLGEPGHSPWGHPDYGAAGRHDLSSSLCRRPGGTAHLPAHLW